MSFGLAACDDTPPPAPGLDAATAQQLFDRLDRLVAALEAMPRQTSSVSAPIEAVAERTQVRESANELVARIDGLEREVARLRTNGGSWFAPPRTPPAPPMQVLALERLNSQLASGDQSVQQEVRRSVFGLTPQQVVERFGMPTHVDALAEHSRYWRWSADNKTLCSVTFVDGLAMYISIE
ncbi:MAG TPA: hypothetical protein VF384_11295 [Planctomycetota bacterium]